MAFITLTSISEFTGNTVRVQCTYDVSGTPYNSIEIYYRLVGTTAWNWFTQILDAPDKTPPGSAFDEVVPMKDYSNNLTPWDTESISYLNKIGLTYEFACLIGTRQSPTTGGILIIARDDVSLPTYVFPAVAPATCSVAVANVTTTNESEPGDEDGTATIEITGGNGVITYAVDGGTPQSSNVFTGLSNGPHTVQVFDSIPEGCSTTASFAIGLDVQVQSDISEEILIEVRPAPCNPVTLCWLNSLGAYETYCFEDLNGVFENEIKTRVDAEFTRYVQDLETDTVNSGITTKTVEKFLKLGTDNVDADIYVGLLDLFTSPAVFILTGTEPVTWQSVRVSPGSISYSEYDRSLEITIELPNMFIQRT